MGNLPGQEGGFQGAEFQGDRGQQLLGFAPIRFQEPGKLLEHDPLVGGVLIDQDQPLGPFHDQVAGTDLPEQAIPPAGPGRSLPEAVGGEKLSLAGNSRAGKSGPLRGDPVFPPKGEGREIFLPQSRAHGRADGGLDPGRGAESHFPLGRVDIDIHLDWVEAEGQHSHGEHSPRETGAHGLAQGEKNSPVLDRAAVDQDVEPLAQAGRVLRGAQEPGDGYPLPFPGQGDENLRRLFSPEIPDPALEPGGRGEGKYGLAVAGQEKRRARRPQCPGDDLALDVPPLDPVGLEKLAPGRGVEEELAHPDRGPLGRPAVGGFQDASPGYPDPVGGQFPRGTGNDFQQGNPGDAGQGLPAEPHGLHPGEGLVAGELAGGVPLQGKQDIVPVHPPPVVGDGDLGKAGTGDRNLDPVGGGVERIFQQFLDHRSRALHHLAGGNLVDHLFGKYPDPAHRSPVPTVPYKNRFFATDFTDLHRFLRILNFVNKK